MASIGHPLVGDSVYGRGGRRSKDLAPDQRVALVAFPRQALHAYLLGFYHPATGDRLEFRSIMPYDFNMLLNSLEVM
jgi:23S rRNA pseudouridine1911/1915/1917 synthase